MVIILLKYLPKKKKKTTHDKSNPNGFASLNIVKCFKRIISICVKFNSHFLKANIIN